MGKEYHIYFEKNKKMWDARTDVHVKSDFYDMEGFKAGKNILDEIVMDGIGDVSGKSVLHLQCHFGQDSICLARLGANVTGVDFSPKSITNARALNEELGMNVKFIESNVLELDNKLDATFDIIFTSYGVLGWLPDLKSWAKIVNTFLKTGGTLVLAEFHPTLYLFDFDSQTIEYNYFADDKAIEENISGTYTDGDKDMESTTCYFWTYSLHNIITPLLDEGLLMKQFTEFPYSPYKCFPNMEEISEGKYVFGKFKTSLPHVFRLIMKKPQLNL